MTQRQLVADRGQRRSLPHDVTKLQQELDLFGCVKEFFQTQWMPWRKERPASLGLIIFLEAVNAYLPFGRWHLECANHIEAINSAPSCAGRSARSGGWIQRIDHFVANHNSDCKAFIRTATADSILATYED